MRYQSYVYQQLIKRSVSLCLLAVVCPVMANPTGGQIAGGSASIRYGSTTVVTQHTDRAIVNWADFSINQGETTRFQQPNSKSVILNRVTGNNASQIMGNLTANGQVFLVNRNGIVFGKTSRVDVAGLVASTADISNADFMKGNYHFMSAPDHSAIINEGTITVRDAGLAALVAPNVQNSGTIQAHLGKVVLAAGNAFTIDLYGDNLISFDATSIVHQGNVTNLGHINAAGGTVVLTAAAADALVENMVNMSGYISATSVGQQEGKIILQGYDNSTIHVSGTLDVSGLGNSEKGGLIQLSANHITLQNGSVMNATGNAGGGTVHVGGEYQGTGTLRHADTLNMQAGALINASALQSGNGGEVILWSDFHTDALGHILAKGGSMSGNGGFIETSSHGTLNVGQVVIDTSAVYGLDGTWLLDPTDINVDDTLAGTLTANLIANNVSISTASSGSDPGDITFNNALTPIVLTNGHSFSAFADNDIIFNVSDSITSNNESGNIYMIANNDITFNATDSIHNIDYSGNIGISAVNDVNFNATSSIHTNNSGGSAPAINVRADSDGDGVGTLSGGSPNVITNTGSIYMYYSPTAFTAPVTMSVNTGDGSPFGVFMLIYDNVSGHRLTDVSSNVNAQYALGGNLSTGLSGFTPIGTSGTPFIGQFTGASFSGSTTSFYSISNMTVSGGDDVGLFGYLGGGIIMNLSLINSSFTGNNNVGSIVGNANGASIRNVFSSATVTGNNNVGGLVGNQDNGTALENTLYHGTVTGNTNVGGLSGIIADVGGTSSITTSLSIATLIGNSNVGGVTGNNQSVPQSLFDVYSSTTTFNGPAVGTGDSTGATALPGTSLTTLPTNFSFGVWQTNGSSNYISLMTCGSNCVFPIFGSSGGGLTGNEAKQYVTVDQILNNNILTTTPTLIYYSDGSLLYTVPLSTGGGIYVWTVTPESNTTGTIEGAFEALKSAYGCNTST